MQRKRFGICIMRIFICPPDFSKRQEGSPLFIYVSAAGNIYDIIKRLLNDVKKAIAEVRTGAKD